MKLEGLFWLHVDGRWKPKLVFPMGLAVWIGLLLIVDAGAGSRVSLVERLGYANTDRLLIINGDDAGLCHAANSAVMDAQERGLVTSASVMVPCSWFLEIATWARDNPDADIGVHLTHTSEWETYRWASVASKSVVPGLLDTNGYLWSNVPILYDHATPEQVEIEARAQMEMALAAGIDVTHIDSHMGTLMRDPRYFEVYRRLAVHYDLPVRMATPEIIPAASSQRLQLDVDGVLYPDYLIHGGERSGESVAAYYQRIIRELRPGVTELFIHPAVASDELKAITRDHRWQRRAEEYRLFTEDLEIQDLLDTEGIVLIGYRALRDLQRGISSSRRRSP